MDNISQQYLQLMGIEIWQRRDTEVTTADTSPQNDWESLEQQVKTCSKCPLHKTRQNTVFGTGSRTAKLMIIGEAPGANEDQQGKPFVGRAGMLLTNMLKAIGIARDEEVFIANILKCRPPNNRDPVADEVASCTPYLQQQLAITKPRLIVTVGLVAAQFLLNTRESMGRLRCKTYSYGKNQIPVVATYHPAYLLRSPREKAKAYIDLLKIKQLLSDKPNPQSDD